MQKQCFNKRNERKKTMKKSLKILTLVLSVALIFGALAVAAFGSATPTEDSVTQHSEPLSTMRITISIGELTTAESPPPRPVMDILRSQSALILLCLTER